MNSIVAVAIIQGGFLLTGIILTNYLTNRKLRKIHKQLNSMRDQELKATKELGNLEGQAEERAKNK